MVNSPLAQFKALASEGILTPKAVRWFMCATLTEEEFQQIMYYIWSIGYSDGFDVGERMTVRFGAR